MSYGKADKTLDKALLEGDEVGSGPFSLTEGGPSAIELPWLCLRA